MTGIERWRRTVRGNVAIVGIGSSQYFRHGGAPEAEFSLVLKAVLAACEDAGIDPSEIDGFSSFSNDRNESMRLASALGSESLRVSLMQWGGGGGGSCAAVGNAAIAVATGQADCVIAYRGLAQGQFGRFGAGAGMTKEVSGAQAFTAPYGMATAAQSFAMRWMRWVHDNEGRGFEAQKAVSLASYYHAQQNPNAVMRGRPLTPEAYDEARWIVEPWRLFDVCLESDGAACVIVTTAERARDLRKSPVLILGAAQGADKRFAATAHNSPLYGTANFTTVAPRLWEMAGVVPNEMDVVQSYENFTGGVVMSLVEHGFCNAEDVDQELTFENLTAPQGKLPLNTSGGHLAEAYVHGMNLVLEGVRQLRGESSNQVPDAQLTLVSGGPMVGPASDLGSWYLGNFVRCCDAN